MTFDEFEASLGNDDPSPDLPVALAALWYAARHDWTHAHRLVQAADGADAAWVHAHLHRADEDFSNASYWYRRAGRPAGKGPLAAERKTITSTLLLGI